MNRAEPGAQKMRTLIGVLVSILATACDLESSTELDGGERSEHCYDDPGAWLAPVVVDRYLDGYVVWEHETDGPIMGFEIKGGTARCWTIDDGYDAQEIELAPMVVIERRIDGYAVLWGRVSGHGCFMPDRYRQADLVKVVEKNAAIEGPAFQAAV